MSPAYVATHFDSLAYCHQCQQGPADHACGAITCVLHRLVRPWQQTLLWCEQSVSGQAVARAAAAWTARNHCCCSQLRTEQTQR